MNIIKFNDVILTEKNAPQLSAEQRELFNTKYKGKYVYALNFKHCIAIEDISTDEYVEMSKELETDPAYVIEVDNIDFDDLSEYADTKQTELANSVTPFLASNKYSSDKNITIAELKLFRTWLAEYLLKFDQDEEEHQQYVIFDDMTTHMLEYYANEMDDVVIKYLNSFGNLNVQILNTIVKPCGCVDNNTAQNVIQQLASVASCGCAGTTQVNLQTTTACDPIYIYRKNIYAKMVETFSNVDFWNQFSKVFLTDFKKYVDNILSNNFPLVGDTFSSVFAECGCLSDSDADQKKKQAMLVALSEALGYLIDGDMYGHINFIGTAFNNWAMHLYEIMRWY